LKPTFLDSFNWALEVILFGFLTRELPPSLERALLEVFPCSSPSGGLFLLLLRPYLYQPPKFFSFLFWSCPWGGFARHQGAQGVCRLGSRKKNFHRRRKEGCRDAATRGRLSRDLWPENGPRTPLTPAKTETSGGKYIPVIGESAVFQEKAKVILETKNKPKNAARRGRRPFSLAGLRRGSSFQKGAPYPRRRSRPG